MDATEFEKQLKLRGWRYYPGAGEFRSGARRLEWEELMGAIKGLTFDDLMTYEVRQHEEWRKGIVGQHH